LSVIGGRVSNYEFIDFLGFDWIIGVDDY
jgi:hypothetical protein